MKKIMNKVNFAIVSMMTAVPAFAANGDSLSTSAICDLVKRMGELFKILRTFAFIGAAFMIAGWAWGFIAGGEAKTDDIKKKGIALLVGAVLLFTVGIILSMVIGFGGEGGICASQIKEAFM